MPADCTFFLSSTSSSKIGVFSWMHLEKKWIKKILINKSVWARLNHASSLSMRGIHVHALVAQRGLAKSVNKDNLIQAATSNDYHYIIIISLSVSVLVHFQVIPRNYNNNIVIVIVITIIISVSIFPSISQELQGKCKPPLFEAQQQSITNYIPPVERIFYSLPGFWIRSFSCYGKVVRILQCDFVQASISLNKKQ